MRVERPRRPEGPRAAVSQCIVIGEQNRGAVEDSPSRLLFFFPLQDSIQGEMGPDTWKGAHQLPIPSIQRKKGQVPVTLKLICYILQSESS